MTARKGGSFVQGVLQRKGKTGFILSEVPGETDVLVQGPSLQLAMDGDRVRARLTGTNGSERRLGEIVEVVERARQTVTGFFQTSAEGPQIAPMSGDQSIPLVSLPARPPKEGDVIVARITRWPAAHHSAQARIEEILGRRSDPAVETKALIRRYEWPDEFPADVAAEAASFGAEVGESALHGRELFFERNVFTIDGKDAKDFDDAVHIERLASGGWRLGVHIADVSHYVRENSPLDREAKRRGTSVYLAGSVVPMLPFALSDHLCSLRPGTVRLTLSCLMDLDSSGRVVAHRLRESAIRSVQRFTYEEVERVLTGGRSHKISDALAHDLKDMGHLAKLLRKKRYARGSLDFDFPEPDIVCDPHGRVIDIQRRERLESHRLIEDFMILANETVAEHMQNSPFLFRIHEKPDAQKLAKLRKTLEAVGVPVPRGLESGAPGPVQQVLSAVEGKPVQPMVQTLLLRSLKQAVYSARNLGHFGLASRCYTHFTSPIRRYPDLIVHRLVRESLKQRLGFNRHPFWTQQLPGLATHGSIRERVAVDMERTFMDIQKVRVMERRVGESFDGFITSVTPFGFFVQIRDVFVEGLVHITNLGDDYYFFDEVRMALRGRRTGRTFRMGQSVRVKLAAANVLKHQLDFELLRDPARSTPPHGAKGSHAPLSGRHRR